MSNKLFGLDISKILAKSIASAGGVMSMTLVKYKPGTPDPNDISSGAKPSRSNFPAKGIIADYSNYEIAQTIIEAGDRKIMLLAATITGGMVPAPQDHILVNGKDYTIIRVMADPAEATYTCQARV